jgi:hypothetical protein
LHGRIERLERAHPVRTEADAATRRARLIADIGGIAHRLRAAPDYVEPNPVALDEIRAQLAARLATLRVERATHA